MSGVSGSWAVRSWLRGGFFEESLTPGSELCGRVSSRRQRLRLQLVVKLQAELPNALPSGYRPHSPGKPER